MTSSFPRTVGPKADLYELEYISALHQTCAKQTRSTGTISSLDVLRFLKSRHSIDISHRRARDIVRGLGGDGASKEIRSSIASQVAERLRNERELARLARENSHHLRWRSLRSSNQKDSRPSSGGLTHGGTDTIDEGMLLVEEALNPKLFYFDLVQMTSVLLIPTLARFGRQWREQQGNKNDEADNEEEEEENEEEEVNGLDPRPKDLLELVLTTMWGVIEAHGTRNHPMDTISEDDAEAPFRLGGGPPRLTPEMVQILLIENGESERADDPQLLQDMVNMAKSKTNLFDMEAFVNALTGDLYDWEVGCEDRQSTGFEDVFGASPLKNEVLGEIGSGPATVAWEDNEGDREINNESKYHEHAAQYADSRKRKMHNNGRSVEADQSSILEDEPRVPPMTPEMVQLLLIENGEIERAYDPRFVQHMVDVAKSKADNNCFDMDAFINALTEASELSASDDGNKVETAPLPIIRSTFKGQSLRCLAEMEESAVGEDTRLTIKGSAKVIDAVVDTFASNVTQTLAWVCYVGFTSCYASLILLNNALAGECPGEPPTFGCTLAKTIVTWIIVALLLVGFGFVVMVPMVYGNHPTKRGPARMFVATVLVLVVTFVPFGVTLYLKESEDVEVNPPVESLLSSKDYFALVVFVTMLGCGLALNYFAHFVLALGNQCNMIEKYDYKGILGMFNTTSHVVGAARAKRAATRKVNVMLTNARKMHGKALAKSAVPGCDEEDHARGSKRSSSAKSLRKAQSDAVFQNFMLRGEEMVDAGSLIWSWRKILSGELYEEEGIWLPSRLIIFQVAQVAIGLFFTYVVFQVVRIAADAADAATAEIERIKLKEDYLLPWVIELVPTGEEVRWALEPAGVVAVLVCVVLILVYIPSTVKTVLKFRCGRLPSLGDPAFNLARSGADKTYMNLGNALFGMIGGAALFFILIGLVIFLFIWDFSQPLMLLLLAWGIGLTVTTVLKTVMVSFCRKRNFRAFYRIFPGRSNISTLALECWYIGLGGGVLIGRLTQFLFAAAFWIGRIDEPFLADSVNLLGYRFDYVPLIFTTEILVHEAHRHPFIERLGTMYLMRLRHKTFGSNAGVCWRQLFTLTLLPWLLKYRTFHEQRSVESLRDQESELEFEKDEDKEFMEVADEILGTGAAHVVVGAKAVGQVGLGTVGGVTTVGRADVDAVKSAVC